VLAHIDLNLSNAHLRELLNIFEAGQAGRSTEAVQPAQAYGGPVWPENLTIQELQTWSPDEQTRLAPLVWCMTLLEYVEKGKFSGVLSNLETQVMDFRLGFFQDKKTPLATVAFRTLQDVQRALGLSELHDRLGVMMLSPWLPQARAVPDTKNRILWFKNHHNVPLEQEQVEAIAKRFSDGGEVSVVVRKYWDTRQHKPVQHPTDIILSGRVEFADENHADALFGALQEETQYPRSEVLKVLKRIPGVPAPIAFNRDWGYVNRYT